MQKRENVKNVLCASLLVVATTALLFGLFLVNEMAVLLMTGGEFSFTYPAACTAACILAIMAFAVLAGGAE